MHLICPRASVRTCLSRSTAYPQLQPVPFVEFQLPFRPAPFTPVRHATHGAQGRANGPKNGPGKRLGAKKAGDEYVVTGNILFRQRGTHWYPGENVGIGRDHTIFALQNGYVKYYRNPRLHPKRQYIGITFQKEETLPHPANAARRRRLGMLAVPRRDGVIMDVHGSGRVEEGGEIEIGVLSVPQAATGGEDMLIAQQAATVSTTTPPSFPSSSSSSTEDAVSTLSSSAADPSLTTPSKRSIKDAKKRAATGRLPNSALTQRPDYSYRESNYSIGRIAERAGVHGKIREFRKGDRFLAWRKRTTRRQIAAEKRAMGKKKGKKDKPNRAGGGGTRKPKALA